MKVGRAYRLFQLIIFSSISFTVFSQTGQVSGKLVDSKTQEPLPFAHVFVSNTTIGTTTDTNGKFLLKNVPAGYTEIVYSFVGYEPYQSKISVGEGQTTSIFTKLIPTLQELESVEVKGARDKEWERQLRRFVKIFLGNNKTAASCKIINPWVIDFVTADNSNAFIAKASAPVEIVNNALGYTLLFYLKDFKSVGQAYVIDGNAYFKEMDDPLKKDLWTKNREIVYFGSDRHLLKSILDNVVNEEGFRLYVDKPGAENANTRSNIFYSEVEKKVVEYNTGNMVTPAGKPYEYNIALKGRTEIHYLKEDARVRSYKDMAGPVSWMEVRGNHVRVNNNGIVLNPADVVLSGEMSFNRVSDLLPLDYQLSPTMVNNESFKRVGRLVEKVYIHTDKPYYYPGEIIWMKGYMNYSQPGLRDSLSKVLYVELINESKKIVQTKNLKIDSGLIAGDFNLPTSLATGNYLLRAYTTWMRNFGEDCFFITPVPVLKLNEKMEKASAFSTNQGDSAILVKPDKEVYRPREKIQLTIQVRDHNTIPLASHLSISVTDERQVVPIKEFTTISNGLAIPDVPKPARFLYPVEYGIGMAGFFKNDKQKPESISLMVIQGKFEDLLMIETDASGKFELNGLQFSDSVAFSFLAKDRRGKPYGKVTLTKREAPAISGWESLKRLAITEAGSPQRIISEYELPKDVTMLDNVTITASKIEEPDTEIQHKIFGKPDHVVKGDVLANSGETSLAVALQGKVPGMMIIPVSDDRGVHYKIRIRGMSTFLLSTEPLVLIDGIPVGGQNSVHSAFNGGQGTGTLGDTAGDRLKMLDVNMIDKVEVTLRTNSLYGEAGRNGVISVFTKAGTVNRLSNLQDPKTVDVFKVAGFSRPGTFRAPNYDDPAIDKEKIDYRSTIYWNPQVKTDSETGVCKVSFFAADLIGPYRIVIEGVTESGEPVRKVSFITVDLQ